MTLLRKINLVATLALSLGGCRSVLSVDAKQGSSSPSPLPATDGTSGGDEAEDSDGISPKTGPASGPSPDSAEDSDEEAGDDAGDDAGVVLGSFQLTVGGVPLTAYSSATSLAATIGGPEVVSYRFAFRTGADAANCDGATFGASVPVATPLAVPAVGALKERKLLCVVGINADGEQTNPVALTWISAAPMIVPDLDNALKRSVAAPVLQAPGPGSVSCGQYLNGGFAGTALWHPTTAVSGSTIYVMAPCKYGDTGGEGWHLLRGSIDLTNGSASWFDKDGGTIGTQEWLNRYVVNTAASTPMGNFHFADFALDDQNRLYGFMESGFVLHPVRGVAFNSMDEQGIDLSVPGGNLGRIPAAPGTWHQSVSAVDIKIFHEAGTTYFYQSTYDNLGKAYIGVTTTTDMTTYVQPSNYLVAGVAIPHVFRAAAGKYLLLAQDPSTRGWVVFQGSSPDAFDPDTRFTLPLSAFNPAPGAWDELFGVSQIIGGGVWNGKLTLVYFSGVSGYTPATAPYGAPRDFGIMEFPLSEDDGVAFLPEMQVSENGVNLTDGALLDLSAASAVATTKSFVIKNTGRDHLRLPASAFVAPAGFAVAGPTADVSLEPGASITVSVTCPANVDFAIGSLTLASNSYVAPNFDVNLSCAHPHTESGVPTNGMTVWLRASDLGSVLGAGDGVTVWPDLTGRGNGVAQGYVSKRPTLRSAGPDLLNGYPVVRFTTASAQCFTGASNGAGANAATIFLVAKGTDYSSLYRSQVAGGADYFVYPWTYSGNNHLILDSDGATTTGLATGMVSGVWNIGVARYESSTVNGMVTRRNGAIVTQRNSAAGVIIPRRLTVGCFNEASEYANADLAELLVFDRALSDVEVQAVETYLNTRYAVY